MPRVWRLVDRTEVAPTPATLTTSILKLGKSCSALAPLVRNNALLSGAGTIFQQGGQDQPFPAGGLGGSVRPQRGPGQSPGGKRILTKSFEN